MTKLKIICAWCGRDMGEKDGKGQEGITSGICPECYKKLMNRELKRIRRNGHIATLRKARKVFDCKMCPEPIQAGSQYYSIVMAGSHGLGNIKYPDRVHINCIDDFFSSFIVKERDRSYWEDKYYSALE